MTTRPGLYINGELMPEGLRFKPPNPAPVPKRRIFDHMQDEPEDARFCAVAKAMRQSEWWLSWVGRPEEPIALKPVKGTIKPRYLPRHIEAMTDEEFASRFPIPTEFLAQESGT